MLAKDGHEKSRPADGSVGRALTCRIGCGAHSAQPVV